MSLVKSDRVISGADCSCSPYSRSLRFHSRETHAAKPLGRKPQLARVNAVDSATSFAQTVLSPESELLSRDALESKLSGSHTAKVSSLQTLERLKGDLQTALQDLEEQDSLQEFSVADWDKLNAARREHLLEELQRQKAEVLARVKRKKARAVSGALRSDAAISGRGPGEDSGAALELSLPSTDSRKLRHASGNGQRGARATAASRTKAHASWGKQNAPEAVLSKPISKSKGRFIPTGSSSVADYMKSMPQHTLLTMGEEAELSAKVKVWMTLTDCQKQLEQELSRTPTRAEWAAAAQLSERELAARLTEGTYARSKMLACNQRLVISIARRYANRGMELADLIQEGMTGLTRSVEKFDHTKGFKFSTYATWWVRQSISRALGDLAKVIRLPVHLHELLMKIKKEERDYYTVHRAWPSSEYVARNLGIPLEKVLMIKKAAIAPRALEEPLRHGDPDAATLGEVIEDVSEAESSVQLIQTSMHRDIDAVLHTLSRREHGILRMRYGLDDGQPKTLEEIGNAFHVTRERIRQIEVKALGKLKEPARHSTLKQYSSGEAMNSASKVGWKQSVSRASV